MNQEFIKRIISSVILIPIALFFVIKGSLKNKCNHRKIHYEGKKLYKKKKL